MPKVKMQLPVAGFDSESVIGDEIKMAADTSGDGPVKVFIRDQIGENWFGEGVSANSISELLEANQGRDVEVMINSPGGSVYEGIQIYNAFATHQGNVTVTIESLAFSAASFIAMSADNLKMMETSQIGIHRSLIGAYGNKNTMQSMVNWLESIDSMMVDLYMDRTGLPQDDIVAYLDGEDAGGFGTVFTAKEAVEIGFADELVKTNKRKAGASLKEEISNTKPGMTSLGKAKMDLFLARASVRS